MIKEINVQIEMTEEKINEAIKKHGSIKEYISFLVDRDTFLPRDQMNILEDFIEYIETGKVEKRKNQKERLKEFFKFQNEIKIE